MTVTQRGCFWGLIRPTVGHFAAITDPQAFGALLRAIDVYQGDTAVMAALRLTPHVFQRPGELRRMEWAEVDFDGRRRNGLLPDRTALSPISRGYALWQSGVSHETGRLYQPATANITITRLKRMTVTPSSD